MELRKFLKSIKEDISLTSLARKVWPDNKDAESYLTRKINGGRPLTAKDEEKIRTALQELGYKLISNTQPKP
ncbi:hypothetical protein [Spirosoma foliorum]|uniref:Uncharacterized protein n=1 Tax=Spirosoma foliorum TaxID=2710596 RepID=A0A7G5H2F6_9BACT|nr:hypothetical protein [Spirosoma foliorum]QMW05298.1 hypothetical protein H3H32_10635 [Spirosoma foliorum]